MNSHRSKYSAMALAAHLAHGDVLPEFDGDDCGCPQNGKVTPRLD